jgi:chromosome segregation ATPase
LDELFGLSDYETAWSNLAGYQKEYDGERKAYEKDPDVAGLEKLNTEYNQTVEQLGIIEIELQDLTKRLSLAKKNLEEADLRLKKLEDVKAKIEELKRKEAQTLANLTNVEDASASLAEKIEKRKSAIENLKQRLSTMEMRAETYKAKLKEIGVSPDQPMEAIKQYLLAFDDQISSLKGEQEAARRKMREDQNRISSLSAQNLCPLCLQPLTGEYKDGLMQKIQTENEERQKTISQLQQDIEELQQIKNKASEAFTNLQTLTLRLEDLKAQINQESQALTELTKEFEEKQKLERELRTQLENLRRKSADLTSPNWKMPERKVDKPSSNTLP